MKEIATRIFFEELAHKKDDCERKRQKRRDKEERARRVGKGENL